MSEPNIPEGPEFEKKNQHFIDNTAWSSHLLPVIYLQWSALNSFWKYLLPPFFEESRKHHKLTIYRLAKKNPPNRECIIAR